VIAESLLLDWQSECSGKKYKQRDRISRRGVFFITISVDLNIIARRTISSVSYIGK
jgi:hypothetical protein